MPMVISSNAIATNSFVAMLPSGAKREPPLSAKGGGCHG